MVWLYSCSVKRSTLCSASSSQAYKVHGFYTWSSSHNSIRGMVDRSDRSAVEGFTPRTRLKSPKLNRLKAKWVGLELGGPPRGRREPPDSSRPLCSRLGVRGDPCSLERALGNP